MPGVSLWLNSPPNRVTAFAIHLLLSCLVFSSLVAVMLVYWFPGDLFFLDGGWQGLKLVALVDLVLGPALTLILFKPGKPGLKFDLSIIAAVQIVALAYGFYTTYNQRTVAVVYAENKFVTVSAKANREADASLLALDGEPKPLPESQAFQVPLLVNPASDKFGKYLASVLNGYPQASERSDQYVVLADHPDKLRRGKKSVNDLEILGDLETLRTVAGEHQLTMDDVEIYRFKARFASGYAIYDPENVRIVDYVRDDDIVKTSVVAEHDG